jgi:hypothetical protein
VKHSYSRTLFIALLVALAVGGVMTVGITVSAGVLGGLCVGSGCDPVLGLYFCQDFLGCVIIAFFAASVLLAWRKAADFDARRQTAAGDGRVLPLADLRLPPPASLALPATIRLRMAWGSWSIRFAWVVALVVSTLMSAFVALVVWPLPKYWPEPVVRLVIFLASDGALLVFYAFVFVILALAMRERFTGSVAGVQGRHLGHQRRILWEDARLFVRIDADRFELAGQRAFVRFTVLERHTARRPIMPFEQYRGEMAAVLHLIVERTSLPLMDLYTAPPPSEFDTMFPKLNAYLSSRS